MNKKAETTLTAAARALDEELTRFEALATELARTAITSEKSLQRARQSLESCSELESRLSGCLHAFAEAMQIMQARQQRCMELAGDAARKIQQRFDERNTLLERVAALGQRAREISEPLAGLKMSGEGEISAEILASMAEVGSRLEGVIEEASAVAVAAQENDWQDIGRDADTLKQQLQAVRNRVLMGQRKLASQAPS